MNKEGIIPPLSDVLSPSQHSSFKCICILKKAHSTVSPLLLLHLKNNKHVQHLLCARICYKFLESSKQP